jgi:hypothetical protein
VIRAAQLVEVRWDPGRWVIVDLGFAASGRKSTAVMVGDAEPELLDFATACDRVVEVAQMSSGHPLMLVLEAPLSICFDEKRNPIGRDFERKSGADGRITTRYWYAGLGCCVMVAAGHMLARLGAKTQSADIRLVEGFVSYSRGGTSDHCQDVKSLRESIRNGTVCLPKLVNKSAALLESSFSAFGMDFGVPPVVIGRK